MREIFPPAFQICICRLYAWSIEGVLLEVTSAEKSDTQCIPCDITKSLAESWEAPSMPCSITECLVRAGNVKLERSVLES